MKRATIIAILVANVFWGCNSPQTHQIQSTAMDMTALKAYSLTKVKQSEYESIDTSYCQIFQSETCSPKELQGYIEALLSEDDRIWFESGDLELEVGRFMPMGMPAVRVVAPLDDMRRFYLCATHDSRPVYADFAYALSPEGYFVGQVQDGNLHVTWNICRVDGFEQSEIQSIVFDGPGQVQEFRWAPGGWLYFNMGEEYYKMHVDIPVTKNCRMKDVKVSEAEFNDALLRSGQGNIIRADREPDADDTAAVLAWAKRDGTSLNPFDEEPSYIQFEGFYECIEVAIGDYCCTFIKEDTMDMQSCDMKVSAGWPRYFGGINMEWGAGNAEVPAFIYIYPVQSDNKHVGRPYIYQTTPEWQPTGRYHFWAAGDWFYLEGYDRRNDRIVYHKLHLP